jgi:hypothetical protein
MFNALQNVLNFLKTPNAVVSRSISRWGQTLIFNYEFSFATMQSPYRLSINHNLSQTKRKSNCVCVCQPTVCVSSQRQCHLIQTKENLGYSGYVDRIPLRLGLHVSKGSHSGDARMFIVVYYIPFPLTGAAVGTAPIPSEASPCESHPSCKQQHIGKSNVPS